MFRSRQALYKRRLSAYGNRRTESASTNFNIAKSLWEHTPPLEGRGRAVRRKVNGRVTGWNPLSLREGEGAGGETDTQRESILQNRSLVLPAFHIWQINVLLPPGAI